MLIMFITGSWCLYMTHLNSFYFPAPLTHTLSLGPLPIYKGTIESFVLEVFVLVSLYLEHLLRSIKMCVF